MSLEEAAALAQRLAKVIDDQRVLDAIASLPRERFVPPSQRPRAYENVALPIACRQTISQPLVVARMLELLAPQPGDRVLDVGTGSGYHAALLARLAARVWTIERHPRLSSQAERTVRSLDIDNVFFVVGDGSLGLPERAPFDVINVAASSDAPPATLEAQLKMGGRLVAPVGEPQRLLRTTRTPEGMARERLEEVRFVPLIGSSG